jgi:exodeoxyribonuclease VII large subunit
MSPLKVLSRGYAMAQLTDGSLLRSVQQVKPGDKASISLGDGTLETQILEVKEKAL